MKDIAYSGINTIISTKEKEILTKDVFESLLKAKDLQSALQLLQQTIYNTISTDFDKELTAQLLKTYDELFADTPDRRVIQIFSLSYTYHNLKVLLKARFTKKDLMHLIIPIGNYELEALQSLILTGESTELPEIMVKNVNITIDEYEAYHKMEIIDVLMDNAYLHHLHQLVLELNKPELLEMIEAYIDLYNLSCLLRAHKKNVSRSFLYLILSPYGQLPVSDLIEATLLNQYDVLFKYFKEASYYEAIAPLFNQEDITAAAVEKMREDVLYYYLSQAMFNPFGPYALLQFLFIKEMETKNLRLILTGKKNGISETLLRERMRPVYGL